MVENLNKISKGEARASLMAKSMRSMMADQMKKDGASADAIASVRMSP